jgi:uracil-DNA glycosylase family 4
MNRNELAAQIEFFRDIGVDSLSIQAPAKPSSAVTKLAEMSGANASAVARSNQEMSGANASAVARGNQEMSGANASAIARSDQEMTLETIRAEIGDCQRCKLAPKRTNIVFGSGNPNAELVFVGEAPGYDEDLQGLPFVGRAGQLLTKIIESIDLKRENVYICNVLKCRPPENRNPEPDEVAACNPFLKKQLATIRPKIVCCLGTFAAQTVLQTPAPISKLRGKFIDMDGIRVIATFHPAYLLRSPEKKREVWEDMKQIRAELFRLRS